MPAAFWNACPVYPLAASCRDRLEFFHPQISQTAQMFASSEVRERHRTTCVSITFTLQAQVQSRLTPGTHTETCCARQPPRPQVTGREAGTACRSVRCGSRVWGKLRRHQCKSRQHCPPQARQPPRLQVNDQPKGRDRVPVCVQCGSREPQPALPDVHVRGQAARRVWGGGLGRVGG